MPHFALQAGDESTPTTTMELVLFCSAGAISIQSALASSPTLRTRPRFWMTAGTSNDIEKLEADLWEAADNLRANSKLSSNAYFLPVLGVIFLRHAANRFEAATRQIEEDQAASRM